jgi:hypothetical protein
MTIDLMPADKWQCLPEDILFREPDPRIAAFRYRFIPVSTGLAATAQMATSMLQQLQAIPMFLSEDM